MGQGFLPSLKLGETLASFQMSGIFSVFKGLWKISAKFVGPSVDLNLSGPATLCGFKHTSSLSMHSPAMLMLEW